MLQIEGIEITQATQFFRSIPQSVSLACNGMPCPDNSLPIVEGKDTVVRVYVTETTPASGTPIRGTMLLVDPTTGNNVVIHPFSNIRAIPAPGLIDRTSASDSLTFLIPARFARGTLLFSVVVVNPTTQATAVASSAPTTFLRTVPIPIRLVRARVNKSTGMTVPAPDTQAFWDNTTLLRKIFPVPGLGIDRVHDTEATCNGGIVTVQQFGSGDVWDVLDGIMAMEPFFPPYTIYVALYDPLADGGGNFFIGPGARGSMPLDRRIVVSTGQPEHFAKLLANVLWDIAPFLMAPASSPGLAHNLPLVDFVHGGGIHQTHVGEVGFDIEAKVPVSPILPDDVYDWSPGHSTPWISPYTYQGLADRLSPGTGQTLTASPPPVQLPRAMFTVRIRRGRVPTFEAIWASGVLNGPVTARMAQRSLVLKLRNKSGEVLDENSCDLQELPGDDKVLLGSVDLIWHDSAHEIVVSLDGKVIGKRKIEPHAPELSVSFDAGMEPVAGSRKLAWKASVINGPLPYWPGTRRTAAARGTDWSPGSRPREALTSILMRCPAATVA